MAVKKDEKEQKSLERAQKDAEMIGEFAKDARNRREAKIIANKLETAVEQNEEKQADRDSISLRSAAELQEQTIQTSRESADNYVESQKEIMSIYQSVWTPFVENANSRFWNYWFISPKGLAETYVTVVSSFADNVIAATRLTNNAISANMGLFSTALQRTKDSSKELSRLGINAAKVFNEASNDLVN
jgi:hypothetical protein